MRNFYIISSDIDGSGGQALVTRQVIRILNPQIKNIKIIDLKVKNGYSIFAYFRCLLLIFKKHKISTVYFTPTRNTAALVKDLPIYILALIGVRVVAHIHGNDIDKILEVKLIGKILLYFYQKKIITIIPSKYLAKRYLYEYNIQCVVLENFIPEAIYKRLNLRKPKAQMNVVWNSNLIVSKGALVFLNCIQSVLPEIAKYNISVNIFGRIFNNNGSVAIRKNLDQLISRNILYHGEVTREETFAYMHEKSIVFLLSRSECQPLALIDAMMSGCYIVVYDYPEMIDLLNNYPKCIFIPKETKETEKVVKKIIEKIIKDTKTYEIGVENFRFQETTFNKNLKSIFNVN